MSHISNVVMDVNKILSNISNVVMDLATHNVTKLYKILVFLLVLKHDAISLPDVTIYSKTCLKRPLSNSYTMGCLPIHGNNQ